MAFDVRLTKAQGVRVIELLARLQSADRRTLEALKLDGHDLRVLDFALYRVGIACAESHGIVYDGRRFVSAQTAVMPGRDR